MVEKNSRSEKYVRVNRTTYLRKGLSIGCWNINGLQSKLQNKIEDPIFMRAIKGLDIFALVETHTNENSDIDIPGYFCHHVYRQRNTRATRDHGGIAVYVRNTLTEGVNFIKNTNSNFQWIALHKDFFKLNKDVSVCFVHNPPATSSYSRSLNYDVIQLIEEDCCELSKNGDILICGDLNAKTGNDLDFIQDDNPSYTPEAEDYSQDYQNIMSRESEDMHRICSRGKLIIDYCIAAQLRILNGRTLGDLWGKCTYHGPKGSSVIDYSIASQSLVDSVLYFKVDNLVRSLSDHCLITTKVLADWPIMDVSKSDNRNDRNVIPGFKFDANATSNFSDQMLHETTRSHIGNLIHSMATGKKSDKMVENHVRSVNEIILRVASLSLKRKRGSVKRRKQKAWFNVSLQAQKLRIDELSVMLSSYPHNHRLRCELFKHVKLYKKAVKHYKQKYYQDIFSKLDDLQENNPAAYWNLLNKLKKDSESSSGGNDKITKISLEDWEKYFKKLNQVPNDQEIQDSNQSFTAALEQRLKFQPFLSESLNQVIHDAEVINAFKTLKTKKAHGLDCISNEMLKLSLPAMLPCYTKLFNLILDSSYYPQEWAIGYISPIYKAGDDKDPSNYRGITVTSALGKAFNTILNNRLNTFLSDRKIITPVQIGFKKNSRTSDHMFILKTLIDKYTKCHKNKLFACFVDFRKAFDSVLHPALFTKMNMYGIQGKFFRCVSSMYSKAKLCVKVKNNISSFFPSKIGVHQGDVLSPNLFKIFINDLEKYFNENCFPVKLRNVLIHCLMYADDIVLLSESSEGLQNSLNGLERFCRAWGMNVNLTKTKVMVFNKSGKIDMTKFYFRGSQLENVKKYKYLGIIFQASGCFNEAKQDLYKKGMKAVFKLKRLFGSGYPGVKTLIHIFEHTVKPILLYGSEIWGYFNPDSAKVRRETDFMIDKGFDSSLPSEKLHLSYLRYILGVRSNTASNAVYGELGRYPLYISVVKAMLSYRQRLATIGNENIILRNAWVENQELRNFNKQNWASCVDLILKDDATQKSNEMPSVYSVLSNLREKFRKKWKTAISNDSGVSGVEFKNKLRTYKLFKEQFTEEKYLTILHTFEKRKILSKFRVSAHDLQIERGRYVNKASEDRTCTCDNKSVEDEIHFLMVCPHYSLERQNFFDQVSQGNINFVKLTNRDKFIWIMSNEDKNIIINLVNFISNAENIRRNQMKISSSSE